MTVRFSSADRSNRNTLANAPNDALIEGFLVSWIGIFDVLIHLESRRRKSADPVSKGHLATAVSSSEEWAV